MKSIIFSLLSLLLLIAFVITSATVTHSLLDKLSSEVEDAMNAEEYENIKKEFEKMERFLSLTLSDNTLCEIEYSILEVRDYLEHGSEDEADAAKSRLLSKIKESRRLSGLNPRSIF